MTEHHTPNPSLSQHSAASGKLAATPEQLSATTKETAIPGQLIEEALGFLKDDTPDVYNAVMRPFGHMTKTGSANDDTPDVYNAVMRLQAANQLMKRDPHKENPDSVESWGWVNEDLH
ncbi:hypothetical protein [Effusibacillus lacus]|uniref:hypothetical protein n=1 Tax=Effusibacillus lacus TaxID=1348429 RepID=UPI000BB950E0|nr:hypothetical protein [Effusibacillus lacus]TCS74804.1 hypothetical protein EDD64_11193 [Effusibacillus lacus]